MSGSLRTASSASARTRANTGSVRASVTTFAVPLTEIMTRLQANFAFASEVSVNLAFAVISTAEKLARAKFDAPSWRYKPLGQDDQGRCSRNSNTLSL